MVKSLGRKLSGVRFKMLSLGFGCSPYGGPLEGLPAGGDDHGSVAPLFWHLIIWHDCLALTAFGLITVRVDHPS